MDLYLNEYKELNKIFRDNGYKLYLVGGTVRDYLLNIPLTDMDAVTDATPAEMKAFLKDANYTFEKYGSVTYKTEKKVKFDITTLREECEYSDSRHPGEIKFVKDLSIDVKRRDFTVNALYLDEQLNVIDLVGGKEDLEHRLLRMIGDPHKRLVEDPLRIIRAIRFACDYNLGFDKELETAIVDTASELEKVNIDKIKMDLKKCKSDSCDEVLKYFKKFHIKHLDDVLK